jgi:hypothetical protein
MPPRWHADMVRTFSAEIPCIEIHRGNFFVISVV